MANVTVYSTPTCPFCIKIKQFLKKNNVEFQEIDVSADHDKAKELMEKSGQAGVPVTEVDGEMAIGYDVTKLRELLNIK